jgi:hypothetical protein
VLSVVEDVLSLTFVVLAFLAPILVALLLLVVFLIATRRRRGAVPPLRAALTPPIDAGSPRSAMLRS